MVALVSFLSVLAGGNGVQLGVYPSCNLDLSLRLQSDMCVGLQNLLGGVFAAL